MNAIKLFGISVVAMAVSSSTAFADNVVVTPSGQTAPAQPVQVQPVQPVQPVQAAPVYTAPAPAPTQRTIVTEDRPHNYVATIAISALLGSLTGAVIGGAIYILDNQDHPANIGYWAAGGVLVGTGVGVINVLADESRAERAVSTRFERDPAPTYRLSLLRTTF